MRQLVVTCISFLALAASYAQVIHDESYLDDSFYTFKITLETALLHKDRAALATVLSDSIVESNNGCGVCAKEEFLNYLFESDTSPEWDDMLKLVKYGFRKSESETDNKEIYVSPSYYHQIPNDNTLYILGEHVNIREKPSTNAKIIGKVSYEFVTCNCTLDTSTEDTYKFVDGIQWILVTLKNGTTGYVADFLTSSFSSRSIEVKKIHGEWKIISYYQPPGC